MGRIGTALTIATILIASCKATIGMDGKSGNSPAVPDTLYCEGELVLASESPLIRLSATEYKLSISALFPSVTFTQPLPADNKVGPFDNNGGSQLTDTHLRMYGDSAADIAQQAVKDMSNVLGGCDPAKEGEDACLNRFFDIQGRRIYRRPLTQDEKDTFKTALFAPARAESDFTGGVALVLEAMLQSTHFLHRVEQGTIKEPANLGVYALSDWELASRLSYFVWMSGPDDVLLDAAAASQVHTPEQLEAQARRMLADPRAKPALETFVKQLLRLEKMDHAEKDPALYPEWTPELKQAMIRETELFIDKALWEPGNGGFNTLLTGKFSFVNKLVASIYGVQGAPATSVEPVLITFADADPHGGLFTQASFLASHAHQSDTSIVQRGLTVRRNFLCQEPPPPPPGVNQDPTLDRLQNPTCSTCHVAMDKIGQGLERFNAIGRYETMRAGKSVPDAGEFVGVTMSAPTFEGGPELGSRLVESPDVKSCMAKQWLRFSEDRQDVKQDSCALKTLTDIFDKTQGNVSEMVVALVKSDTFRFRRATAAEGCTP